MKHPTPLEIDRLRRRIAENRADLKALALNGESTAEARADLAEGEAALVRLEERAAGLEQAAQQRAARVQAKIIDDLCAGIERSIRERVANFEPKP